jgi:hypothetical protein
VPLWTCWNYAFTAFYHNFFWSLDNHATMLGVLCGWYYLWSSEPQLISLTRGWYSVAVVFIKEQEVWSVSRKVWCTNVSCVYCKFEKFGCLIGVVSEPFRIFGCLKRIVILCLSMFFCRNKYGGAKRV